MVCEMCSQPSSSGVVDVPSNHVWVDRTEVDAIPFVETEATEEQQYGSNWACRICTCDNPAINDVCDACGELRPPAATFSERLVEDVPTAYGVDMSGGFRRPFSASASREFPSSAGVDPTTGALYGAGLGAGLAFLQGRSVTRGALEGAGVGLVGSLFLRTIEEMQHMDVAVPEHAVLQNQHTPIQNSSNTDAAPGHFDEFVNARFRRPIGLPPGGLEELLQILQNTGGREGLTPNDIEILPSRVYRSCDHPNGIEPCSVCLEPFEDGDNLRMLPCFHQFHNQCIDTWLRRSRQCPVCKTNIMSR